MTVLSDDAFVRLFQQTFGLEADGWAGADTVAKLRELEGLAGLKPPTLIPDELPADYWPMLSKIESSDQPYVQALSSSASGLYQFIRSTWLGEGGKWGPTLRPAFGGLRPSPEEQLARAKTFTAKNAAYLRSHNIPINRASLYAAHFLGPVTARADLMAGEAATKANESILRNKTVAQFLSWLQKKTGEWAR